MSRCFGGAKKNFVPISAIMWVICRRNVRAADNCDSLFGADYSPFSSARELKL